MIVARRQTHRRYSLLPVVALQLMLLWGAIEAGPPCVWAVDPPQDPPAADTGPRPALTPDLEKQMDLIRARILSRRGFIRESLSLYRDLRARFPGDKEIWIDLIEIMVNDGRYEEASEMELGAFLEQYPRDSRALRLRARVFFEQGRFKSAYPVYDDILEDFPDDAGLWSDYGYARQEDGDWAGALNCFSRTLELDPENQDALRSVHGILRDHLPRLSTGYRVYRQEEGDAEWASWFLRHERHLTERSWWTFAYDEVLMDRPEQPFLPAVSETLRRASLGVDYAFNRFVAARAGAGIFSGVGGGHDLALGVEGRPHPSLVLDAHYSHGLPWYDPIEAVAEEGREHRLVVSAEWSGWSPWTIYAEADRSDFHVRDLHDYGRRQGLLGVLSRRFGDNPFLQVSYAYERRRFRYGSETLRPVAMVEREHVHGISALFEHRPCTYWTYRLRGGVRRDTFRKLDSWFASPEILVRMGNRVDGRLSFEHSSEAGTVEGGTSRTFTAGLRILF